MENLPDVQSWEAQNLRLTAFPVPKSDIKSVFKWEETIGELPENSSSHPRAGMLEESGGFGNGILSLKLIPGRIDWHYLSFVPSETVPESFPNLGYFLDTIELFKSTMLKWFDSCSSVNRLAFGAQLIRHSESHKHAYNMLNEYLHSVEVDPDSSDFSYSINRKRSSGIQIPGLEINRLSKWRAVKMINKVEGLDEDPIFGVNLELDINTVPKNDLEITKEYFPSLFNELIEIAIEIAENGDIK